MMERLRNHRKEDQGFTLIELLVVMIIIGILAAIAIPIFLCQRQKAQDSAARADVSTLGKEIATWFVDNTTIPTLTQNTTHYFLNGVTVSARSDNVTATTPISGSSSTNWCVAVTNPEGDVSRTGVHYSAQGGLQDGTC